MPPQLAQDRSNWHKVSVTFLLNDVALPFPSAANALLVKQVVEVDELLRPNDVSRTLTVSDCTLHVRYEALTISMARVAMDHALSDIQLIVQTMHKFAPVQPGGKAEIEEADSLEVGLMGSWGGDA
ncbi:EKC/KEOPS complex subunit LAGE3/PCC1, partial [Phenoliferia sp. Uapishka_3]